MHLKVLLSLMSIGPVVQPMPVILEHSSIITNLNEHKTQQYFIKSCKNELEYLTKKEQEFVYIKTIKDEYNHKLLYIQYTNCFMIIDPDNYETLEAVIKFNDEKIFEKDVFYLFPYGLVYKEGDVFYEINSLKKLKTITNDFGSQLLINHNLNYSDLVENKKRKDYFYNLEEMSLKNWPGKWDDYTGEYKPAFKTEKEVSHSWFFRESYEQVLHTANNAPSEGLCEYVALNMLILYNELFVASGFYSDDEWNEYFKPAKNNEKFDFNNIRKGLPTQYSEKEQTDTIIEKLWRLNREKVNFKFSREYKKTFKKFIKNKSVLENKTKFKIIEETSAPFSTMTISPGNPLYHLMKGTPVILTYAIKTENHWDGHAILVYGFDSKTNTMLCNFGWYDKENSQRVISCSKFKGLPGFTYSFQIKQDRKKETYLRKAFQYNGINYSSQDLIDKGWISKTS